MFLLQKIRERKMRPFVDKEKEFYQSKAEDEIADFQLQQFNKQWRAIQEHVPFYRELVEDKGLPTIISSYDQFTELPIVTRDFVNGKIESFISSEREPDKWGSTGGSTGNPLQFPQWNSENTFCEPSTWYVRDFYNVNRADRMFRLWGHSHTLGKGITKVKNKLKFDIGLPLIGYKRFSAYDLSETKLKEAGEVILRFKPKYIIGYSKALNMLAKANEDKRSEFHKLNLKAIMGAAEGFEKTDDKEYVSDIFGCPVALQYAAMETNYIAHTHPEGGYKVIWRNNLIECVDDEGKPANTGRILITSLYPRAFPLVRYELGDIITGSNKDSHSVYSFKEVQGRDNDFLMLDENTPIHSEGITHAIKFSNKVVAYQIRYTKVNEYTIYVRSNGSLTDNDLEEISNRLKQVDTRLGRLKIKQVDQLKQTVAGKTNWLIEE